MWILKLSSGTEIMSENIKELQMALSVYRIAGHDGFIYKETKDDKF